MKRALLLVVEFMVLGGLARLEELLGSQKVGKGDVLIVWGQHLSVHRVLAKWARARGATVLFTEGSELQGSLFVSETGILNYAWPRLHDQEFRGLPLSEENRADARSYIEVLTKSRFSNKEYDGAGSELEGVGEGGRPVIYVNGLENFASGLRPRCASSSRDVSPQFGSNREILLQVLKLADKHDWEVLYKDHPNTFNYNKRLLVTGIEHPRLRILQNVDIHAVMDRADAMVSLCSKVVLLALARNVPVVLGGQFSVTTSNLKYGFEEDPMLEAGLTKVLSLSSETRVDEEGLVDLIARVMTYYAYRLPEAPWDSVRDEKAVWRDIDCYLAGERDVVSCDIRLNAN